MAGPLARPDPLVADRIVRLREMRGYSIRTAADLAGIAHTTWSRIERGEIGTDNRFTLAKIAQALGWSVADLVAGQTIPPNDEVSVAGWLSVAPLRRALVETELTDSPQVAVRTVAELEPEVDLVRDLRMRGDFAGQGQRLPQLLRDLHAAALGPERGVALRLLVEGAVEAQSLLQNLEFPDAAYLAAERAHQAAMTLDDPLMLGLAAWVRGHSALHCESFSRTAFVANEAIPVAERALNQPGGPEMFGSLHMLAGYAALGLGRRDDCEELVGEASRIADRTGDSPALALCFGPTNIRFWRVAMEVEDNNPGKAVEISRATLPDRIEERAFTRRAMFYLDTSRAYQGSGKPDQAVRAMLTAERLAPPMMHAMRDAREVVRVMLREVSDGALRGQLRGLAERMGMNLASV